MTYKCIIHEIELEGWCPRCTEFINSPIPETLVNKIADLEMCYKIGNHLSVELSSLNKRIGDLLGRPICTHELAESNWPNLFDELESGNQKTTDDIIIDLYSKFGDKVIVVDFREKEIESED